MPEAARSLPILEDDTHAAAGPLRDWLAAMKRHAVPAAEMPQDLAAQDEPAQVALADEAAKPASGAEVAWGPRLVQPEPAAPTEEEAADVSELMAENLMLKARLKVEFDRQDALQSALAEQIRELREHIAAEMNSLDELRSEQEAHQAEYEEFRAEREQLRRDRDALRAERDRLAADRDSAHAQREALTTEREIMREERDLWRARAEALAQPLFQINAR
jgi:FtsZ-binding cell division protein ZapB